MWVCGLRPHTYIYTLPFIGMVYSVDSYIDSLQQVDAIVT
jgi:hypothetical protein